MIFWTERVDGHFKLEAAGVISWTVVTLQKVNTVALLCWTLDCSLSCIPAVNSVWEYFHHFSSFPKCHLLKRWWSYLEENGTKVPKLQKTPKQNAICLCPLRPFRMTSHIHEGSISLCSVSPPVGMQYTVSLLTWTYWHFCVIYSRILLLMTDKYTDLFLFCYISYIYINISLNVYNKIFFFLLFWVIKWMKLETQMLQKGVSMLSACSLVISLQYW